MLKKRYEELSKYEVVFQTHSDTEVLDFFKVLVNLYVSPVFPEDNVFVDGLVLDEYFEYIGIYPSSELSNYDDWKDLLALDCRKDIYYSLSDFLIFCRNECYEVILDDVVLAVCIAVTCEDGVCRDISLLDYLDNPPPCNCSKCEPVISGVPKKRIFLSKDEMDDYLLYEEKSINDTLTRNKLERKEKDRQRMESDLDRIRSKESKENKPLKKAVSYLMKDNRNGLYKIGRSRNPKFRESTLQSEKPDISMVKVFKKDHESELHQKYKDQRVRGEWFELNKVQVKFICTHYK